MTRITVIGSANVDFATRVRHLPRPGETLIGSDAQTTFGGKGANQAVAAARLGAEIRFVGKVGDDELGTRYVGHLKAEGIDTGFLLRDAARPTGSAFIFVDSNGGNMIVVAPGANLGISPADIESARPALEWADAIVLQLEIPLETVYAAVRLGTRLGKRVLLNAAPMHPELSINGLQLSALVVNEIEAAQLGGAASASSPECTALGQALRARGAESVVITRGGEPTCVLQEGDNACAFLNVHKVQPIDTVGAGDTFTGALAVGWCEGMTLCEAARFANGAAALATLQPGAQTSMPRRDEVERLLRQDE